MRAVRIFPIYWCVLAVTVVLFWKYPPPPNYFWSPASTLQPKTLLNAVFLSGPNNAIVPVAWTLTYELIFYAFFALYLLCGTWVFAALALAWSAALAAQWTGIVSWPYPILLRPIVGHFFVGCLAAFLVKRFAPRIVSVWWVLLALGVCLVVAKLELNSVIDGYTWWAAPYFMLILAGAAYDQATRRRYPRALVLLGEASYSIYLVHYGLIVVFAFTVHYYRPLASKAPNVTLTLVALTILAVGILVHLAIERPLLASVRRRVAR